MRRTTSAADLQRAAQKKKVIILAVLVGVLGLMWLINALKGPPAPAVGSPSSSTMTTAPNVSPAVVENLEPPRIEVQIDWPAVSTRDPFVFDDQEYEKQEVQAPVVKHVFDLQGTILGNDPRALINGKGYRIGQSVDGAVIKRIGHGQVTLEIDGVRSVKKMSIIR